MVRMSFQEGDER
uniref:Uncharacterized protein n=1 Tax=Nymphaea colorata TaxID=210225 RepID=A0A5K1H6P6_9MAGN|nr:unnamed protein product [Nymphaea colorata]